MKKAFKYKKIKKSGFAYIRANYFTSVIVCFILVFLTTGPISISETIRADMDIMSGIAKESGVKSFIKFTESVENGIEKVGNATSIGEHSDKGVISTAYKSSVNNGGFELAFAKSLNNRIFHGSLNGLAVNILGYVIMFAVLIFISGLIRVGACRFFLENRIYVSSPVGQIFFIYRIKRIMHTASIVALKILRLILWAFTIVGLPIKYYAWYLTPYILAENPNIDRKEIFKLSASIMKGYKMRVFLFELSFIPWILLSLPTFGILQYLFITPYFNSAKAELYMRLRAEAKANAVNGADLMNDCWLEAPPNMSSAQIDIQSGTYFDTEGACQYPFELSDIPERRNWQHIHRETHYTVINLVLLFFIFSFVGWVYECTLDIISTGTFVNRGTMYGPWIPIYGIGGVSVLILLKPFKSKPVLTFFLTVLICGVIEYVSAWYLETFMHMKYWDYAGYFFNIQGRVCLEGLLIFGMAGIASIYSISPLLNNLLDRAPMHVKRFACIILSAGFLADLTYTGIHPHTGKHISYDN
jgi:hypothetical protein